MLCLAGRLFDRVRSAALYRAILPHGPALTRLSLTRSRATIHRARALRFRRQQLQRELADALEQESRDAERRIAANVEHLLVAGVPAIQQALAVQLPSHS